MMQVLVRAEVELSGWRCMCVCVCVCVSRGDAHQAACNLFLCSAGLASGVQRVVLSSP